MSCSALLKIPAFLFSATALLAACANAPKGAVDGRAALAQLVSGLDRLAAAPLTPPAASRLLHARALQARADPVVFASFDFAGRLHFDSAELSGEAQTLDLFPGADCISPADLASAAGDNARRSPLDEQGFQLAWARAGHTLTATFQSQARCATQLTLTR